MNAFLQLSIEARLLVLFVIGTIVGGQINRAIYGLAYNPRPISPWGPRPENGSPRRWWDYLPLLGWFGLARESSIHGRGHWIRPLFIELGVGALFAWMYQHVLADGAFPPILGPPPSIEQLHAQFVAQMVLICVMLAATFIDFDEQLIPDELTVVGTVAGLLFAYFLPISHLRLGSTGDVLLLTAPYPWSVELNGPAGLAAGLACFLAWVAAVVPIIWYPKRGLIKAYRYALVSVARLPNRGWYMALAVIGVVGITAGWHFGGPQWETLISSLIGMVFGGAMIWAIRIAGSSALGREAMGFGDVILMAMIGAFTGWQPAILIFFVAPLTGLFIALGRWIITGRNDIAYGPYLCLAAFLLIVFWTPVWDNWANEVFRLGWWLPVMFVVGVCLIWIMLTAWVKIRNSVADLIEANAAKKSDRKSAKKAAKKAKQKRKKKNKKRKK